ncbi:MAG: glutamyl-tRNA amidotransferase [Oscillospiraceae bacterium]|nr:glutamyl-tRNA amidotransferase [Oscillospiraceae bacterium]
MKKPTTKRAKIFMSVWSVLTLCVVCFSTTAFATGSDPITVVNNLSDFIFSAIKAIGIIILGWGIVQVGMSIQSHDASQRSQGFLCLFGGLVIAFAKEILAAIGAV